MDVNKITLDQPAGPKASNAPRGGDGSFQVAYAKVLSESYAPTAREGATAHPLRGQDSPLINRVSVTIPRKVECRLYLKTYTDPIPPSQGAVPAGAGVHGADGFVGLCGVISIRF